MARGVSSRCGFSLLELLISVAIFTLVMTIASGALISLLDANLKNRVTVIATNNLNVALETMVRAMELADDSGYLVSGSQISFTTHGVGQDVSFRLHQDRIERQVDGGTWVRITSRDVHVNSLGFQRFTGDVERVRITISAHVGDSGAPAGVSEIYAQTSVSQNSAISLTGTTLLPMVRE